MTAREYLEQAYHLDQQINSKIEQVESLHALATKATATMNDSPVQQTRNAHSMEDVAKYVGRIIVMNQGQVMFDDVPKEVFRHYKELEAIGLAAPQVTYLMHELKEEGFPVSTDATTVDEARDEILRVITKRQDGTVC